MQAKEDGLHVVSEPEYLHNDLDLILKLPKGNNKRGQQRIMKLQTSKSKVKKSFKTDKIEIKTMESKIPKKKSKNIQIPEETKTPSASIKSKKRVQTVSTVPKAKNSTQKRQVDISNVKSIAAIQMKIEDALVKANVKNKKTIKNKTQSSRKEIKIYACQKCDFHANKLTELKQHERKTHAGSAQKIFRCESCGNLYQSAAHLIRHSVVHSRTKNEIEVIPEVISSSIVTPEPEAVSSQKPIVTPEPEAVSSQKPKRFACLICKSRRSFTYQSGLVAHLARHLKGPIPDKGKRKVSTPSTSSS